VSTDQHPHQHVENLDDPPSALPTRKLVASAVAGIIAFALTKLAIQLPPEIEQALNVLAMLAAGYLVPNAPTPGGVPTKGITTKRPG
jgi:hypothetical protein